MKVTVYGVSNLLEKISSAIKKQKWDKEDGASIPLPSPVLLANYGQHLLIFTINVRVCIAYHNRSSS